jgi:hypothetical protein
LSFGKFKQSGTVTTPVFGSLSGDIDADGWFVYSIASYPLATGFSIFGHLHPNVRFRPRHRMCGRSVTLVFIAGVCRHDRSGGRMVLLRTRPGCFARQ